MSLVRYEWTLLTPDGWAWSPNKYSSKSEAFQAHERMLSRAQARLDEAPRTRRGMEQARLDIIKTLVLARRPIAEWEVMA